MEIFQQTRVEVENVASGRVTPTPQVMDCVLLEQILVWILLDCSFRNHERDLLFSPFVCLFVGLADHGLKGASLDLET